MSFRGSVTNRVFAFGRRIAGRFRTSARRRRVFEQIYAENHWGDQESRSGPGSNSVETSAIEERLSRLLRELRIGSVLDLPCGEFGWISRVDLTGIAYLGADVVPAIVRSNRELAPPHYEFRVLDIVRDRLPRADLILVRDCLVHLPLADGLAALRNVARSGANYLLTTSFEAERPNREIPVGGWRPLNLELPPFNLPAPRVRLREAPREIQYSDKALCLWACDDIDARKRTTS